MLRLLRIIALNRETVAPGAKVKSGLGRRYVGRDTPPGFHRGVLQGAAVRKGQLPRGASRPADVLSDSG